MLRALPHSPCHYLRLQQGQALGQAMENSSCCCPRLQGMLSCLVVLVLLSTLATVLALQRPQKGQRRNTLVGLKHL